MSRKGHRASLETRLRMSESHRLRHIRAQARALAPVIAIIADGQRLTGGSEACRCKPDCGFPCWQRVGIAAPCETCRCPFSAPTLAASVSATTEEPA